jgi:hypothetical protein
MTVGVSHTFGGTVAIVDLGSGLRFDMTPAMAMMAADRCEAAHEEPADNHILFFEALDERTMRWVGGHDDLLKMATDLREHAKHAAEKAAANDGGGAAA